MAWARGDAPQWGTIAPMLPAAAPPTRFVPHEGRRVGFLRSGVLVIAGGWPAKLTLVDPASGAIVAERRRRTLSTFLAIAPDGARMYTGEKTAAGYALPGLRRAPSLKGHRHHINDMAFSEQGDWVATVSGEHMLPPDHSVRVWDPDGPELGRVQLDAIGQQVVRLDEGRLLVSVAPATLLLLDLNTDDTVWKITAAGAHQSVGPVALSLARDRLYAFCRDLHGTGRAGFVVLDPWTGAELDAWPTAQAWSSGRCNGLAVHPVTGHLLASLGDNGSDPATRHAVVRSVEPRAGAWAASYGSPRQQTGAVAISPDGAWLAARLSKTIGLWRLA